MSLRWKSITALAVVTIIGSTFLRVFRDVFVFRSFERTTEGLATYAGIVFGLMIITSIILYFWLTPADEYYESVQKGKEIKPGAREKAIRRVSSVTFVIILVNVIGFIIGPIVYQARFAAAGGFDFFSSYLWISLLFSFSIGLICGIAELQIIESSTIQFKIALDARVLDKKVNRMPIGGQNLFLTMSVFLFTFGLTAAANIGYYHEEIRMEQSVVRGEPVPEWYHELRAEITGENDMALHNPVLGGRLMRILLELFGLAALLMIFVYGTVFFFTRIQKGQFKHLRKTFASLNRKDLQIQERVAIIKNDEIGDLTEEINSFLEHQENIIGTITTLAREVFEVSESLNEVSAGVNETMDTFDDTIKKVQAEISSETKYLVDVKAKVTELLESTQGVANNIASQVTFVEESSAAVTEMTASIASVSQTSKNAFERSKELAEVASEGDVVLKEVLQATQDIDLASQEVVKTF
jgi:methyl-accepting chemotaxis protein